MKASEKYISSLTAKDKIKILFVCLGNICRSPAAQAVMQSFIDERGVAGKFILDSAGLYGGHAGDLPDARMRVHARRRGYDPNHISRPFRSSDFEDFDLIIGMDESNISRLRNLSPSVETDSKIFRMADFLANHPYNDCIPDPYYEGAEGFELVLDLLEDACHTLTEKLL